MDILRQLAKEMDEEYEGIVGRGNERLVLEGGGSKRDRQTLQMNGRLDILARWAARLRVEADRGIVRQFQQDYTDVGAGKPVKEKDLRAEIKRLEKELEYTKAVADGRDPAGPASRHCPQCQACGRDGSEGAVTRESCLRLVLAAEKSRDKVQAEMDMCEPPHEGEMPPPPPVFGEPNALEALRVWRTEQGLNGIMVRPSVYEDPFQWGMVVADIIRYVCHSATAAGIVVENDEGEDEEATYDQVLERLMEGMEAEMERPTDEPKDWTPDA